MRDLNTQLYRLLAIGACLIMSGCFQGYGQNVSSQEELDALLLSLTPGSQGITTPVGQPTESLEDQPTDPPTRVPTLPPSLPPPTETAEPIVVEGGIIIHIVQEGDTLFNIAQQYGVTVEALSTINAISDPNALFVDQALIIPNETQPSPDPTEETTQTSNLPTPSPTPFPTATYTPSFTPTTSFTPIPSATSTWTLTPITIEDISSSETPMPTPEEQLSASTGTIHVVETGQTLFQISQTYDIPLDDLSAVNNITDPAQVGIGQELLIPASMLSHTQAEETIQLMPTETPRSSETVHVVSAGETLYQISLDYSISLEALARSNNINDTSQLITGRELLIPVATPMTVIEQAAGDIVEEVTSTVPQRIALNVPTQINGVPLFQIVNIAPSVEANILNIYQQGQALGRNPRAFSKLGDSTIENPHFLARFDNWQGFEYYLGEYGYLEGVIDYFAGSFIRQGAAVRRGMHSWTVFDPQWADKSMCGSNESALACEFRLHNPSILLIRLGANDVGVPKAFENNLRDVIEFSIKNGVIPVLGTKADRNDGASNANNLIIRRLAEEYELPLWDFDQLANTLPRRGLTTDGVHMTINFSHDYTDPNTFRTGHGMHNLSALILLDSLWQILTPDIG